MISAPSGRTVTSPWPALQGLQRPELKVALRCVGGCEIAAGARAAPAAAASCDNDLEVPAGFRPACANMRGIYAHDEFAFWINSADSTPSGGVQPLKAARTRCVHEPSRRGALPASASGGAGSQRTRWVCSAELGHHLRRFAVRQETRGWRASRPIRHCSTIYEKRRFCEANATSINSAVKRNSTCRRPPPEAINGENSAGRNSHY